MLWYDPDEIKAEVDGLRRQPKDGFPPPEPEVYDGPVDYLTEDDMVLGPAVARVNAIADIVATVIAPNQ